MTKQELTSKVRLMNEIEAWFMSYDAALSQYIRKKLMYESKLLSKAEYSIEQDKIIALNKEAEEKAKTLSALKKEI